MADILETIELTMPGQSGWVVDYRIRREDGEELHAEVRCWNKALESAERAGNNEAISAIRDRGRTAAAEYAEQVDSPSQRGAVTLSIWFDRSDDGNLRRCVAYERSG